MSELIKGSENEKEKNRRPISRRGFLKFAGVSAATVAGLGLYGCQDSGGITGSGSATSESTGTGEPNNAENGVVNLGSGDVGILNYAYALEQLEAAFYIEVMNNQYPDMTDEEGTILEDLRKHEVAHRDFYNAALGDNAIPGLEVDFSAIDFGSRESVLGTAMTFEDLGVSAYNGAGQLLENGGFLLVAGKIVSVEARHAAAIRDLLNPLSADFAGDDIVNEQGLGVVNTTGDVLAAASDFIVTEIDASNLPQPQN